MQVLVLSSLLMWSFYQNYVCLVFNYSTDEKKPKWVTSGRKRDKLYDNRTEEEKESEEEKRERKQKK